MTVLFADEQHDPLETEPLISLARSVLEAEALPDSTEVSIVLIDRDRMAGLNREHMGKDATTDVLSFPIEDLAERKWQPSIRLPPCRPWTTPSLAKSVRRCRGSSRG